MLFYEKSKLTLNMQQQQQHEWDDKNHRIKFPHFCIKSSYKGREHLASEKQKERETTKGQFSYKPRKYADNILREYPKNASNDSTAPSNSHPTLIQIALKWPEIRAAFVC